MTSTMRAVLGMLGGGGTLAAAYFSPTLTYVVAGIPLITVTGILVIAACVIHRKSDKPIERVMRIIEAFLRISKASPEPVVDPPAVLEQKAFPSSSRRRPQRQPPTGSGKR